MLRHAHFYINGGDRTFAASAKTNFISGKSRPTRSLYCAIAAKVAQQYVIAGASRDGVIERVVLPVVGYDHGVFVVNPFAVHERPFIADHMGELDRLETDLSTVLHAKINLQSTRVNAGPPPPKWQALG
jgi:hypothetical protein